MTYQEAIDGLKYCISGDCTDNQQSFVDEIEIAIKALEKQIPQKPDFEGDGYDDNGNLMYDTWYCPCCHKDYEVDYEEHNFCPNCGQAIDFGDLNGIY